MEFVCGVVEGFYGTPWKVSERKELFSRLKSLELNTYMYAPKDDAKHRKLWREKYTSIEKEVLKLLIEDAKANGIAFVYSISPGLDIVFSSPADINFLKEKLEQVYMLGCHSFAFLFDDIDPELCLADKTEFSSFGDAQIHVSNKIYEWFDELELVFFCPTEYCISRAKPDVQSSEYLQCLGNNLHSNIHIMWTGPKVVSQTINPNSIRILSKVLKRKPVIWDNIHANDYDQRRVYLGPFKGRPMDLYECTSGILTNPNCEFECNFIAIHSFSTWLRIARSLSESKAQDCSSKIKCGSASDNESDIKLSYDPNMALRDAVQSWMELFQISRDNIQGSELHSSKITISTNVNSLVSDEIMQNESHNTSSDMEEPVKNEVTRNGESDIKESEESEQSTGIASPKKKARSSTMSTEDVLLLCDLFHLPYEHGDRGIKMISDFKWLKENAVDYHKHLSKEKVEEWVEHAKQFSMKCQHVEDMFNKFLEISNKRILEQLLPYIYDVKEAVYHLSKYVKWLGSKERQLGNSFVPEDPEAWFYRGGIAEEMERLLPIPGDKTSNSLMKSCEVVPIIRPYVESDKKTLYGICRTLSEVPEAYANCPDIAGDSLLEAYLQFSPEAIFVVCIDDEVCGFVAANSNGKKFYRKIKEELLPIICSKLKKPGGDPDVWSAEERIINRLYYPQYFTPNELFEKYPAVLTIRLLPIAQNVKICRQAIKCLQSVVKKSMCCQLKTAMKGVNGQLLKDLGFDKINFIKDKPKNMIIYGLEGKRGIS